MEIKEVSVEGGKYIGKKWFIRLSYKVIETGIDFADDRILLSQGSGFFKAKNYVDSEILYKDIATVSRFKKFSIPNVITSCLCVILGIAMDALPEVLIPAVLILLIGKTAVVKIAYAGGAYIIPVEAMSAAEEIETKINLALNQWRNR